MVKPLFPAIEPKTVSDEVIPVVPTLNVCPLVTVNPKFAVINPAAVIVCRALMPELIVKPLFPVMEPKIVSGDVVPLVPILTDAPVVNSVPDVLNVT